MLDADPTVRGTSIKQVYTDGARRLAWSEDWRKAREFDNERRERAAFRRSEHARGVR